MSDDSFGVSTHFFHEQRLDREHLVDIAAHGFDAVELFALRSHFDCADPLAVERLGEWLDDTRLALTSVHAPIAEGFVAGAWRRPCSIASADPVERERAVAVAVQAALELATVLPYQLLIVHVGVPDTYALANQNDAAPLDGASKTLVAGCRDRPACGWRSR